MWGGRSTSRKSLGYAYSRIFLFRPRWIASPFSSISCDDFVPISVMQVMQLYAGRVTPRECTRAALADDSMRRHYPTALDYSGPFESSEKRNSRNCPDRNPPVPSDFYRERLCVIGLTKDAAGSPCGWDCRPRGGATPGRTERDRRLPRPIYPDNLNHKVPRVIPKTPLIRDRT